MMDALPPLIPRPALIEPAAGAFPLEASLAVIARTPAEKSAAALLAADLRRVTGRRVRVVSQSATPAIVLTGGAGPAGGEAYALSVEPGRVEVRALTEAGLLRGVATLRQLVRCAVTEGRTPLELRGMRIEDRARFPWRGVLLDCCRHYLEVPFIEQTIDRLSLYGINKFHWHLTDDQGWRLEVPKFPRLQSVAAWRGPARYGGTYTRAQVRAVVAFARARGVDVVPEIELPGHSQAALAAYPELGCTGGPYEVATEWGVHKDVYCAGNDATLAFLEGVLDETCRQFPGRFVHLGADEVPKDRWAACPKCRARIRAEGLTDERQLQSWFVGRMIRHLQAKGKRVICWDEILEGGPPPGVIVQVWRADQKAVSRSAAAGCEVIHSPYSHVYLDYDPSWAHLKNVYGFEPTLEGDKALTPVGAAAEALLLGGEACVWTEGIEQGRIDEMLFPRVLAAAEVLWSPPAGKDFGEFRARVERQLPVLAGLGVTPGRVMPEGQ